MNELVIGNLTLSEDGDLIKFVYSDRHIDSTVLVAKWNLPRIIEWLQLVNDNYWKERCGE